VICGIGMDIVEVCRVEKIIEKWGNKFTKRYFSESEINYCEKMTFPAIHFSARFAVKESFIKAVGVHYADGLHMKDIETIHNDRGGPVLKVYEKIKEMVDERKIKNIHVTISHTKKYAVACVILEI
jgi:holo-[acyl-carrier-protein] synthase